MHFLFKYKKAKPQGFVKYEAVNVPSRLQIHLQTFISIQAALAGIVLIIVTVAQYVVSTTSYQDQTNCYLDYLEQLQPYDTCSRHAVYILPWYLGFSLLFIAFILACVTSWLYHKNYVIVRQGQIVKFDDKDNDVCILGYTYANELKYQWHDLTFAVRSNYKVGDFIDFR
jgi:hypothetical protein